MAIQITHAHWRDSAREVKFFILDGKSAFPMFLFLVHIQLWTFCTALVVSLFFAILRHFGFTMEIFGRVVRGFLAGPHKSASAWWDH